MTVEKEYIPESEAITQIQELESRLDLLSYRLEGWSIWPLFRLKITRQLQNLSFFYGKKTELKNRDMIPIICKDLYNFSILRKSDLVYLGYASNLLDKEENLYKDVFFDEVLKLHPEYIKVEHLVGNHFFQEHKNALIKSNFTTTTMNLFARILLKVNKPTEELLNIAKSMYSSLFDASTLIKLSEKTIVSSLRQFQIQKLIYSIFLRRISSSCLVLVTAYGEHALIAAAKELGVQVIELQHGFIDRYHVGYSWNGYAKIYKKSMPIPDRIFLYGEHWRQELIRNGFWDKELISIGSLRIDNYRKRKKIEKKDKMTIVLTTQGVETEGLIDFMDQFLRIVNGKIDFVLYIKLHPGEQNKKIYEKVLFSYKQVVILTSSEQPSTLDLILNSNFHISIYSTCHYEALSLGIPTAVLALNGYEHVRDLYENGYAPLITSPENLVEFFFGNSKNNVTEDISNYYFRPNALQNILEELII